MKILKRVIQFAILISMLLIFLALFGVMKLDDWLWSDDCQR